MNTHSDKEVLLITGASGFLGQHAKSFFAGRYLTKTLSLRTPKELNEELKGIDIILFLTGIAHQSKKINDELYYQVNKDLSFSVAQAAKISDVKHFIYISSIKAFGEGGSEKFSENSVCHPKTAYGKSKLEAEKQLLLLSDQQFIVSIIRPAVVYGQGAKGNIQKLADLIQNWPIIPLGGIHNKRSMVYVGNFLALLQRIIESRSPGIFIASDSEPVSTSEMVAEINTLSLQNKKIVVFPSFFKSLIHLIRPRLYEKLFGDFVVDNSETNRKLNFTPPYTYKEGLQEMFKYASNSNSKGAHVTP